jgi:hypothetical protein
VSRPRTSSRRSRPCGTRRSSRRRGVGRLASARRRCPGSLLGCRRLHVFGLKLLELP